MSYYQGQSVELRVSFTDVAGAPILSPTGVSFRVRKPDGTTTDVAAVADAGVPGDWIAFVTLDQHGGWIAQGACTGPRPAVELLEFIVKAAL